MDQSIIDSFSTARPNDQEPPSAVCATPPVVSDSGEHANLERTRLLVQSLPRKPGLRLLARGFDLLLFGVLAEAIIAFFWPGPLPAVVWLAGIIPGILLYLLADALLMIVFGTTPGKRLLRVTVKPETWQPMTFRQALKRSLSVGWHGLALGMPGICLVTLYRARSRLMEKGRTHWDEAGQLYVIHEGAGIIGPIALFAVAALLLLAGGVLGCLIRDRTQALPVTLPTVELEPQESSVASSVPAKLSAKPVEIVRPAPPLTPAPPAATVTGAFEPGVAANAARPPAPAAPLARPPAGAQQAMPSHPARDTAAIANTVWAHLNAPDATSPATPHRRQGTVTHARHPQAHPRKEGGRTAVSVAPGAGHFPVHPHPLHNAKAVQRTQAGPVSPERQQRAAIPAAAPVVTGERAHTWRPQSHLTPEAGPAYAPREPADRAQPAAQPPDTPDRIAPDSVTIATATQKARQGNRRVAPVAAAAGDAAAGQARRQEAGNAGSSVDGNRATVLPVSGQWQPITAADAMAEAADAPHANQGGNSLGSPVALPTRGSERPLATPMADDHATIISARAPQKHDQAPGPAASRTTEGDSGVQAADSAAAPVDRLPAAATGASSDVPSSTAVGAASASGDVQVSAAVGAQVAGAPIAVTPQVY